MSQYYSLQITQPLPTGRVHYIACPGKIQVKPVYETAFIADTGDALAVDVGLLSTVVRLAALSFLIVVLPVEMPMLVPPWFIWPIVGTAVVSFLHSFISFSNLYATYLENNSIQRPGSWMRWRWFRLNPYWEMWLTIQFFGLSLPLLLAGLLINWIMK